jgi:hypothetical protein
MTDNDKRREDLERINAYFEHMVNYHPNTLNLALVGAVSLTIALSFFVKFLVTGAW